MRATGSSDALGVGMEPVVAEHERVRLGGDDNVQRFADLVFNPSILKRLLDLIARIKDNARR